MTIRTHTPTLHTQVDGAKQHPEPISLHAALSAIRKARRRPMAVDAVHVYECTDREGTALHIAYVHYVHGHWSGVNDVIDVYEIPTATLTDL